MNKSQKSIFVDCHVFDASAQGTTTYLKGIYLELIKDKEINFYLASFYPDNLLSIFGEHDNIIYIKYSSKNKYKRLLIEIPRIIKSYKIQYAHFQYITPLIKGCKFIVTTHDILFLDFPEYFPLFSAFKNKILYRLSTKYADIRLTVSEYSKKQIATHFNTYDYQITPNAVDKDFFQNYEKIDIQNQVYEKYKLKNYIIFISRWEPRKNHHLVLKTFIELELYKDHQLLFIGDTSIHNEEYYTLYNNLGEAIKAKIFKFEKTDFKSMLLLLRGAKVSVYPSIAEGFGIPPLESIAAKIPTICSNSTSMKDFEFMEKFQFDPCNEIDFKNKLKLILENDYSIEFEEISKEIQKKYDWKKSAEVLKNQLTDF